jgi:hypothetical protein
MAFKNFIILLVILNIYYLFLANTIGFSHFIPVFKSQFILDLQAINISS